jgi:hypothetical protein
MYNVCVKRINTRRQGTTNVLKKIFWVVVPGTNCSQKKLEYFFGPKIGDLVPGQIAKKKF